MGDGAGNPTPLPLPSELTKTYTSLASAMRDHLGLGLVVALFYLGLSLPLAHLLRSVEERLGSKVWRPASA
ncbi:hypothetical protein [Polyangium jinanense]|uniref:Uncharacterized protein n=1 Tax=Polyangium jinanense TaxID=2829994 RepID=A0A9X3XIH6_9BACT|nr:hypothetical protein [Polyangium jinanense]MDC3988696.1 hypothetical protein [Polyangium jinanense]